MAKKWTLDRGEELTLGVSFEDALHGSALLTGTPTVSVRKLLENPDTWEETAGFSVANAQVNASEMTDSKGRTIPVGEGVLFDLTTADDPGEYTVRIECAADDGTAPVVERGLVVSGSPKTIA